MSSFKAPAYLPAAASLVYRPLNPGALERLGRRKGKKWPVIPLIVLGFFVVAIVGFVIWSAVNRSGPKGVNVRKKKPPPPINPTTNPSNYPVSQTGPPHESNETIFVSIASYRDSETAGTLYSLFQNAAYPGRVFVGLCLQSTKDDGDAVAGYADLCSLYRKDNRYMDSIRTIRWAAHEAEGPCKARSFIEQHLYKGEQFYLVLDAHTRFEADWDVTLVEEWTKTVSQAGHSRVVLTGYPASYRRFPGSATAPLDPALPTFMSPSSFDPSSELPVFGSRMCVMKPPRAFPQLGLAGCFSFSLGSRIPAVPYLSDVPFLFFGEEFVMGALLWTHGWDTWMATRLPLRTLFDRSYAPTFWEVGTKDDRRSGRETSLKRVYTILQGRCPDHPLGTHRDLQSYEGFLGLSLMNRTIEPLARAGVSPEASQNEITCKYGSVTALQSTVQAEKDK
jgi:[Skp1-protein]-hydroxyproline N-acetylglucosaminyltransferase